MVEGKTVSVYKNFDVERAQIAQNLAELKDKSTKGSIDEPIRPFLDLINAQPDWISTSTCSGRLVSYLPGSSSTLEPTSQTSSDHFYSQPIPRPAVNGKGGGNWLFVSHSTLDASQLANPIQTLFGDSYDLQRSPNPNLWTPDRSFVVVHFVYQPPVFHLLVRSVALAVPILTTVIGAGFRNSGITVGHRGRVILAIRATTGGLDVPIAIQKPRRAGAGPDDPQTKSTLDLLVSPDYLSKLLLQGNQLMLQNHAKLQRLFEALSHAFSKASDDDPVAHWESTDVRRQRMRAEGLAIREASFASHSGPASTPQDEDLPSLSLLE